MNICEVKLAVNPVCDSIAMKSDRSAKITNLLQSTYKEIHINDLNLTRASKFWNTNPEIPPNVVV